MKAKIRKEEIKQKLREIDDAIEAIAEHLPSALDEFSNLGLVKDGIYKKAEFAIESLIDVCNIINTDMSLGVPTDEDDIISNVEKSRIVSKKLTGKIRNMKGFRNILVHRYGKIEDELAFDILQNNLSDFNEFKKEILKMLGRKK